jgi:hypothetical protein
MRSDGFALRDVARPGRPPNTRLKLSAPVLNGCGSQRDIWCASILFVNISAWRRSLSAIR